MIFPVLQKRDYRALLQVLTVVSRVSYVSTAANLTKLVNKYITLHLSRIVKRMRQSIGYGMDDFLATNIIIPPSLASRHSKNLPYRLGTEF